MNGKFLKLDSRNMKNIVNDAGVHNYVLLGESTHGTAEFFELRLRITKALISQFKFNIIFFENTNIVFYILPYFYNCSI